MPLPRKKDAGGSGAPVLNLLNARVRLVDVEEHVEPYTVTRKSDGMSWTLDPARARAIGQRTQERVR
jgi:hypothetical protein